MTMRKNRSYAFRGDLLISDFPTLPDLRRLRVMATQPDRGFIQATFPLPFRADRAHQPEGQLATGVTGMGGFLQLGDHRWVGTGPRQHRQGISRPQANHRVRVPLQLFERLARNLVSSPAPYANRRDNKSRSQSGQPALRATVIA